MGTTILQSATSHRASARLPKSVLAGRILTGIAIVLFAMDASMKVAGVKEALEGTAQLGYPVNIVLPLGLIQVACLMLYAVPRTSVLGAMLITAYLGGAVATHVRLGNPLFTHILSPVYFAIIVWGGLYLRDSRVRAALRHHG